MPNKQIQSLTVEGVTYDIVDNTSGYIKTFTETDPTVPAWAKASTKPTYTAIEVGALPSSTVIPSKTSDLTNDSGYLTASDIASVMTYKGTKANYAALPVSGNTTGDVWHLTDTGAEWAWDGSAWQELGTAIDLSGYVPTSRTVNGKALSSNITLTASDVGAAESSHTHGYLTNDGTFSAQSSIGNGDYLVITDKSDSYKLKHSGLAFDGSTTTKALTQKGTWETFLQSYTEIDPVFSASAANEITATDITNWNAKTTVQIVRW